jgi:hypothetical protein
LERNKWIKLEIGVVVGINDKQILAAFEGDFEPRMIAIDKELYNQFFLLLD